MVLTAERGRDHGAEAPEHYQEHLTAAYSSDVSARLDSYDTIFIKRMLQRDLPTTLRQEIVDELFQEWVSRDEIAFSRELYMSLDQVAYLRRQGHYVGSHGYEHVWLNSLSPAEQEREVLLGLSFLEQVGADLDRWIMCYPYGGYDDSLLEILQRHSCVIGLTTQVDIGDIDRHGPLTLPRLDTIDLPTNKNAPPCEWTQRAESPYP